MTASNGGIPSDEVKNYFNSVQSPFPIPVEGKIDTVQFLEAARGVVSLIEIALVLSQEQSSIPKNPKCVKCEDQMKTVIRDQFGNVFAPVKYDMTGNIEKLTQVYSLDEERHSSLGDMVLLEHSAGGVLATDALLWLRRALHLIQRFFELILEDNNNTGGSTEELVVFLKTAYQETLNGYHTWHIQLLFSMLCRMCPNRSKLFQVMSLNRAHTEAVVYRDMAAFTTTMRVNIDLLAAFYKDHQLECDTKV